MPVTDLDSAIEDLYSIAVNPTHAYHSDSQTALFLLSTLADVIQSLKDFDIPNATAYKLPISYILFDSAIEIGIMPSPFNTSLQTASDDDHYPILAESNWDGIRPIWRIAIFSRRKCNVGARNDYHPVALACKSPWHTNWFCTECCESLINISDTDFIMVTLSISQCGEPGFRSSSRWWRCVESIRDESLRNWDIGGMHVLAEVLI